MAGNDTGFDAAGFREGIRFAMTMGMPASTAEQGTFRWKRSATFAADDIAGDPYDWGATPTTSSQHADTIVPIAVEASAETLGGTEGPGRFNTPKVVITILDEDYAQIVGAVEVEFAGNVYDIDFVSPPMGLFDVTIYQVHATARDES